MTGSRSRLLGSHSELPITETVATLAQDPSANSRQSDSEIFSSESIRIAPLFHLGENLVADFGTDRETQGLLLFRTARSLIPELVTPAGDFSGGTPSPGLGFQLCRPPSEKEERPRYTTLAATMTPLPPDSVRPSPVPLRPTCAACGCEESASLMLCYCMQVHYCSSTCQRLHWTEHQKVCMNVIRPPARPRSHPCCCACGAKSRPLHYCPCRAVQYCDAACQQAHWSQHRQCCMYRRKTRKFPWKRSSAPQLEPLPTPDADGETCGSDDDEEMRSTAGGGVRELIAVETGGNWVNLWEEDASSDASPTSPIFRRSRSSKKRPLTARNSSLRTKDRMLTPRSLAWAHQRSPSALARSGSVTGPADESGSPWSPSSSWGAAVEVTNGKQGEDTTNGGESLSLTMSPGAEAPVEALTSVEVENPAKSSPTAAASRVGRGRYSVQSIMRQPSPSLKMWKSLVVGGEQAGPARAAEALTGIGSAGVSVDSASALSYGILQLFEDEPHRVLGTARPAMGAPRKSVDLHAVSDREERPTGVSFFAEPVGRSLKDRTYDGTLPLDQSLGGEEPQSMVKRNESRRLRRAPGTATPLDAQPVETTGVPAPSPRGPKRSAPVPSPPTGLTLAPAAIDATPLPTSQVLAHVPAARVGNRTGLCLNPPSPLETQMLQGASSCSGKRHEVPPLLLRSTSAQANECPITLEPSVGELGVTVKILGASRLNDSVISGFSCGSPAAMALSRTTTSQNSGKGCASSSELLMSLASPSMVGGQIFNSSVLRSFEWASVTAGANGSYLNLGNSVVFNNLTVNLQEKFQRQRIVEREAKEWDSIIRNHVALNVVLELAHTCLVEDAERRQILIEWAAARQRAERQLTLNIHEVRKKAGQRHRH